MGRVTQKFKVVSVAILFALSLLAGAAVTAQAQWWPDPYYGRTSKEQRKWEKEREKQRRKDQKEWEKRERKREKESRKARERWERDGYYDGRDYEYDRYGRRDRDYDYGDYGRGGDAELRRAAYERGVRDGLRAGSSDRASGRGYDYDDHGAYRNAGYNDRYGRSGEYEDSYREGFRRGYDEGYRRGDTYRRRETGWGRILGDIIGRP